MVVSADWFNQTRAELHVVAPVSSQIRRVGTHLRIDPPEPSDGDVYVSAAQVRRCELVSGDRVAGPVRTARRSERYPSLVRVDTINGAPADAVAEGTHYDDLRNVYGVDSTGAARPTWDNVGVQYGLASLKGGQITPAEFLHVNWHIGGWKHPRNQQLMLFTKRA